MARPFKPDGGLGHEWPGHHAPCIATVLSSVPPSKGRRTGQSRSSSDTTPSRRWPRQPSFASARTRSAHRRARHSGREALERVHRPLPAGLTLVGAQMRLRRRDRNGWPLGAFTAAWKARPARPLSDRMERRECARRTSPSSSTTPGSSACPGSPSPPRLAHPRHSGPSAPGLDLSAPHHPRAEDLRRDRALHPCRLQEASRLDPRRGHPGTRALRQARRNAPS